MKKLNGCSIEMTANFIHINMRIEIISNSFVTNLYLIILSYKMDEKYFIEK